jgi:hypothetical protein
MPLILVGREQEQIIPKSRAAEAVRLKRPASKKETWKKSSKRRTRSAEKLHFAPIDEEALMHTGAFLC